MGSDVDDPLMPLSCHPLPFLFPMAGKLAIENMQTLAIIIIR